MTSKELTALEALELLKKIKKNNIDDQEVEDMLLDIIEEKLKEHRLLKNIEEEVGIDLITLFNIDKQLNTKKEIWFKNGNEIEENFRFDSYYIIDLKHKAFVKIEYEPLDYLYFKDYGKTWALTKEELEDDK